MDDEVTGEQLYEVYSQGMAEQSVQVDTWDQLDESDHYAWEVVAAHVRVNFAN